MEKQAVTPIILAILDGWGHSNEIQGNAIQLAQTPTISSLLKTYPNILLNASGLHVGLPEQQPGNSEVGHTTIGGGRVLPQDLARISMSIRNGSFSQNELLNNTCKQTRQNNSKIHLIGLCSDGGVHSHINHLIAILDLIKQHKISNVCIHFIADGRDTKPNCASIFIEQIQNYLRNIPIGQICTISGRYYAMDRDCRWQRTEAFYKILTEDESSINIDPLELLNTLYNNDISDEFIVPTRLQKGKINDKDSIIFFNFRPDRIRQIVQAFVKENFKGFPCLKFTHLNTITFTNYDSTLNIPVVFKALEKTNFLGEILSKNYLKQLRIAETEKYAHVTYFFNGGIEEPFPGEDRELIPSPQVSTYDESPDMSARQITKRVIEAIQKNIYSLIVVNFANPDMIGHTGNLHATIKAIETVDQCIMDLYESINKANGTFIITADHGNAEYMIDQNNIPCKSHTTNLVPFILIEGEKQKILGHGGKVILKKTGCLADIAPTILSILQIQQPKEMSGTTLITQPNYELRDRLNLHEGNKYSRK
jgi:2,3-bisphosphoglycerate-independent phosphoglycerate mutase|uniref:2,3-bisphosphoglycerate-independent phosphoglycerate mutase n=1 Tax=Kumanoa mahlacensis TaxID=1196387 RepID=A0A8K1YUA8_9FLOR|nr:Phosphoglycerate mutase [Kumanoa mahlacensis]